MYNEIKNQLNSLKGNYDENYYVNQFNGIKHKVEQLIENIEKDNAYSPKEVANIIYIMYSFLEISKQLREDWSEERNSIFLPEENEDFGFYYKIGIDMRREFSGLCITLSSYIRNGLLDEKMNKRYGEYSFDDFEKWYCNANIEHRNNPFLFDIEEYRCVKQNIKMHRKLYNLFSNIPLSVLYNDLLSVLCEIRNIIDTICYEIERITLYLHNNCHNEITDEATLEPWLEECMNDIMDDYDNVEEKFHKQAEEYYKHQLSIYKSECIGTESEQALAAFWQKQRILAFNELKKYPVFLDARSYCDNMNNYINKLLFASLVYHQPGLNDFFTWHIRELYCSKALNMNPYKDNNIIISPFLTETGFTGSKEKAKSFLNRVHDLINTEKIKPRIIGLTIRAAV